MVSLIYTKGPSVGSSVALSIPIRDPANYVCFFARYVHPSLNVYSLIDIESNRKSQNEYYPGVVIDLAGLHQSLMHTLVRSNLSSAVDLFGWKSSHEW